MNRWKRVWRFEYSKEKPNCELSSQSELQYEKKTSREFLKSGRNAVILFEGLLVYPFEMNRRTVDQKGMNRKDMLLSCGAGKYQSRDCGICLRKTISPCGNEEKEV